MFGFFFLIELTIALIQAVSYLIVWTVMGLVWLVKATLSLILWHKERPERQAYKAYQETLKRQAALRIARGLSPVPGPIKRWVPKEAPPEPEVWRSGY